MAKTKIKSNDPDEILKLPTESVFLEVLRLKEFDDVQKAEMEQQRREHEARKPKPRKFPYKR